MMNRRPEDRARDQCAEITIARRGTRTRWRLWTAAVAGGAMLVSMSLALPAISPAEAQDGDGCTFDYEGEGPAGEPNPSSYAQVTFGYWCIGASGPLEDFTGASVAQFLQSLPVPEGQQVVDGICEGAAGSTYCTWPLTDGTELTMQVNNALASEGQPHAVIAAEVRTAPDMVAVWPFTSQEAADNSQASVDEGHSPWMVDPATVVLFYADNVLGWGDPEVTGDPDHRYTVVDGTTGVVAYAEVSQPARQGEGGIWAITLVGVSEPAAEDPPTTELPTTTVPVDDASVAPPAEPVPATPEFTG